MNPAHNTASGRVTLPEGSIGLPQGFDDRTTNVFVPADPQHAPNLSITRDRLNEGESLPAYVDRQLALLKRRLPGHKLLDQATDTLGEGETALSGERIDCQYRNGAQVLRQRQAVFLVAPGRALIVSATTPRQADAAFDALWRGFLRSFAHAQSTDAAAG